VTNTVFFVTFFERVAATSSTNVLHQFMDLWLDKFDYMPQTRMRKIACMGMLCILATPPPRDIITFLPQILTAVVGILPETENTSEAYDELSGQFVVIITYSHSAAEKRLQQLMKEDVVHATTMRAFLVQKLDEIAKIHGPNFHNIIKSIDPIILKGLGGWDGSILQQ
jgi:hypothetical protein